MRPTEVCINLAALRANYALLAERARPGKLFAVVKADAYGHGALAVTQALSADAHGFAVAIVEEALELRGSGISHPLLVLEGALAAEDYEIIVAERLWPMVHTLEQLIWLQERANRLKPLPERLFLFLDTGMHREGLNPEAIEQWAAMLKALGFARSQVVWSTHLACADEPDHPLTQTQLQRFHQALARLPARWHPVQTSIANSAALLTLPQASSDWSRAGIALYGINPAAEPCNLTLQPVMTLQSRLIATRTVAAGESIGYGAACIADRLTRVGLVPIGYGDGYPRAAPQGTPVLVNGYRAKLIGRVSMDLITIDLTDLPKEQSAVGALVELWGKKLSVSEIAVHAGTIPYELLTRIKRVTRRYE